MSEQSTITPNRLRAIIIKGTAIAATGTSALALVGCTPSRPGLNEFSHCDPSIRSVRILDNAVIRSEPTTDKDPEGPLNSITKVEFGDDSNYEVDEFLNVPKEIGGACIRIARGYGGDGNGDWFGLPATEVAKKFHNKGVQDAINSSPDGYVWVNDARADAEE